MTFLHDLLGYQCHFLNIIMNWRFFSYFLCVLSAMPCVFGKAIVKTYFNIFILLLFGSVGVFICRYLGWPSQLGVLGFTFFAFAGVMLSESIERLFVRRFGKAYKIMLNGVSCCFFPAALAFVFRRYWIGILSLCICVPVFAACEHFRIKNKRQFFTYEDLAGLSNMEEV